MSCVACANRPGGCERCRGGPGEQGWSLAEKELLEAVDRAMRAETRLRELDAAISIVRARAAMVRTICNDLLTYELLTAIEEVPR